jgi:hypothetical protein
MSTTTTATTTAPLPLCRNQKNGPLDAAFDNNNDNNTMAEGGEGSKSMTSTMTTAATTAPLPLLGISIFGLCCCWQQELLGGREYNQTPHSLSQLACGLRQTIKPIEKTTINLPKHRRGYLCGVLGACRNSIFHFG